MKNLKPEIIEVIREALKRPTGTVSLKFTFDYDLFDPKLPGGIIFDITSGVHYFRLERTDNLKVNFYHSSPGTGTRVSTIDLKLLQVSKKIHFIFSWSTNEIKLYMGPIIEGGKLISAIGVKSEKQFKVDKNGNVIQVGDKGVQIIGARVNENGKQILKPSAIEVWRSIKNAIEILLSGISEKGYVFEVVKANFCIVMLVTGLESYCKTRFEETEREGVSIDLAKLNKNDLSKEKILDPLSNYFQNFTTAKKIYNLAFKIKFGDIITNSNNLDTLTKIVKFRNRIVHSDPLLVIINEFDVPKSKPRFSTNEIIPALKIFDSFIESLHVQTLRLSRQD